MKTNEVKACVIRQLRRLQVLPEPQRRAELAELRRGVGRQPGVLPALWGALLADMPEQLQGSNGPSKAEWAVYTALTLFALHQQGEAGVSMNQPGRTLGGAVRQLAEDLYQYQFVDGAPNVRLRWGRDLYASPTEKTKENEKEN